MIEETIERLRENGLANDNKFARVWVENRNTFRPRSRRVLTMELRQKGLDDETVHLLLQMWTKMLWRMNLPANERADSKLWNGASFVRNCPSTLHDAAFRTP